MPSLDPIARATGSTGARYRAIAQIGRGGMAEALLAMMDAGCGARRLVVLKRIWPELASDPEFMTMFMDEARLSVRLEHPNLVRTFEVVDDADGVAIAMEYLDGQPLTRVLNRLRGSGELSVPLRLRILSNVLAGLEHAHGLADLEGASLGVVHRDVSPQNVFVTYDGQVKLVDFGVAKTLAASHHTRPGALKGKLAYMAPEQMQPAPIDRRADLFAVGIMLWEMLAEKRMWQGMSEVQIVTHLSLGLPFPSLPADGSLPAGLDAICERALQPDPERRYQTAAEMEIELDRVSVGAADSHARDLGKVVSLAFAAERAERQALIESGARRTTAAELPIVRAPNDPDSTPSIEVNVSDLGVPLTVSAAVTAPIPVPVPSPAPLRWVWPRRMVAAVGMAAVVALLLRAEGARPRPIVGETPAAFSLTAQGASPPAPRPSGAVNAPDDAPAPASARPVAAAVAAAGTAGAVVAEGTVAREAPRAHRHHHRSSSPEDEDATLPPTLDVGDGTLDDPPLRSPGRHQTDPAPRP